MYLLEDIPFKKEKLSGKKGDKVKIVSEMGCVFIVELNGDRFAVNKKLLSETKNGNPII